MKDKMSRFSRQIKNLPEKPGVYLFRNIYREVIYVGKARSIKKRVRSYFNGRAANLKTRSLMDSVCFFDYVLAGSEAEALLYEAQLIKKYLPKYNILLKDDKAYPLLKVTVAEPYPRLLIVRKKENDGAFYFGPYTDSGLLKEALKILRRMFPLRSCAKLPQKPCLYYHLEQCLAPCRDKNCLKEYDDAASGLVMFLKGKHGNLIRRLRKKMKELSESRLYEEAAAIRDRIETLSEISEARQNPVFKNVTQDLRSKLRLKREALKIDAFDVSTIFGSCSVGACVRFYEGLPDKSNYRRFKIKSVRATDDYAMIKEIVFRRYKDSAAGRLLPDLIVIDGGRGQLKAAQNSLKKLKISVPLISIAKEKEEIFLADNPHPLLLQPHDKSLKFIQRVRDEAHRFAISYHRSLRKKMASSSVFKEIKRVGPKRYKELVKCYPDSSLLRKAGLKDLIKVPLIDEKTAKEIISFFKKTN